MFSSRHLFETLKTQIIYSFIMLNHDKSCDCRQRAAEPRPVVWHRKRCREEQDYFDILCARGWRGLREPVGTLAYVWRSLQAAQRRHTKNGRRAPGGEEIHSHVGSQPLGTVYTHTHQHTHTYTGRQVQTAAPPGRIHCTQDQKKKLCMAADRREAWGFCECFVLGAP